MKLSIDPQILIYSLCIHLNPYTVMQFSHTFDINNFNLKKVPQKKSQQVRLVMNYIHLLVKEPEMIH
jgi:hypothetical protein